MKVDKKQRGRHLFNERVITDRALSYNGAKTATRKHFFQKQLHKWTGKGKKVKENLQT